MVTAIAACLVLGPTTEASARPELIRVLLNRIGATATLTLSSQDGLELYALGSERSILEAEPGVKVTVTCVKGRIEIRNQQFDQVLVLSKGRTFTVVGSAIGVYRGRLRILPEGERLLAINEVGLEAYLMGVVPAEVPPSFHPEALKAQAVAARTFALSRILRAADSPYDLDDTTSSQSYLGFRSEKPQTNEAIRLTANQVLLYGGEPVQALYCTTSGGVTAANEEAFGGLPLPYLRSVLDVDRSGAPYGAWSPQYRWEFVLRSYPGVGIVKSVEVLERTPSGRAASIRVVGERGTLTVRGPAFRNAVGVNHLKSLLFESIEATGEGVRIRGRGWGHGVGMCQAGAQGRALSGQTYDRILSAYYPGVSLTFLAEPVLYVRELSSSALRHSG